MLLILQRAIKRISNLLIEYGLIKKNCSGKNLWQKKDPGPGIAAVQ
jgi:hypothetical protein